MANCTVDSSQSYEHAAFRPSLCPNGRVVSCSPDILGFSPNSEGFKRWHWMDIEELYVAFPGILGGRIQTATFFGLKNSEANLIRQLSSVYSMSEPENDD